MTVINKGNFNNVLQMPSKRFSATLDRGKDIGFLKIVGKITEYV